MGNIGEKGIHATHNNGMVEGIFYCSFEVDCYEHCVYGK